MSERRRATFALAITFALCGATGLPTAHADDELRDEVRELRRLVEDQARQIEELKAADQTVESALDSAVARYLGDNPDAIDVSSIRTRSKRGSSIDFYGFLRADAQYNDSRAGFNNQIVGFALSEDPSAPPGVGAGRRDRADFTIHPRLTRFGVDLDGGEIDIAGPAHVTGKLEVDFYEGGSNSRSRLRMRKAYVNLAWGDFSILAGQTTEVIAPLYATVNSDLCLWGAGNLGDRRPQIRATYVSSDDNGTWTFQGMLGQTGAIDGQNFDGNSISDGQKSAEPTLQGRVSYRTDLECGKLELGVWAHRAEEDPDVRVGLDADGKLESNALGIDFQIPLAKDLLWLKGEAFAGRNLDDVRGGIFQGVNAITGDEIDTKGGFVELGIRANDWMTWHVGYSRDNPDDSDLNVGGRDQNDVWWVSTRMGFGPVSVGVEYLHWATEYVGFGDGDLQRVAVFVAYNF